jgi:hypothetical protein
MQEMPSGARTRYALHWRQAPMGHLVRVRREEVTR